MRVNDELSEVCQVGKGVRQGCCLSPLLYIMYDEAMMKEATENVQEGISVGGALVRYADDRVVVASSQRGLQYLMVSINKVSKEYNMKINTKKTKIMSISRQGNHKVRISIDGQQVEQVDHFKYLGSVISGDGYCELRYVIGLHWVNKHLCMKRNCSQAV